MNGFPYDDDWRWTGEVVTVAQVDDYQTLEELDLPGPIHQWFCLREDGFTFIPGWDLLEDACAEAAWLMGFDPARDPASADGVEPVKGP